MSKDSSSKTVPTTEGELRQSVRAVIIELSPNPDGQSAENPRLVDDLEYHSLALLELAFALEDEYELNPIDEKTARKIQTVKDVEDHVVDELRTARRLS
jgi:acyl carrier protein